ncbi:hypothetical protein EG329_009893, partial [Mollisiaceae sp. DMI_Dod_QoI]
LTCLCKEIHQYEDCPYIMENKRGPNWKGKPEIQKMVDEQIERNPRVKGKITHLRREAQKSQKAKSTSQESLAESLGTKPPVPVSKTPNVTMPVFLGTGTSENSNSRLTLGEQNSILGVHFNDDSLTQDPSAGLNNSFILDSGATIYVCNKRERFTSFTPAAVGDFLQTENGSVPIEGWGNVILKTFCPDFPDGRLITITQVAYASDFPLSVISLRHLIAYGVHWDTENQLLRNAEGMLCWTPMRHDQWVLEYNPPDPAQRKEAAHWMNHHVYAAQNSRQPLRTAKGTAMLWH